MQIDLQKVILYYKLNFVHIICALLFFVCYIHFCFELFSYKYGITMPFSSVNFHKVLIYTIYKVSNKKKKKYFNCGLLLQKLLSILL